MYYVTISGSFRKFAEIIVDYIESFEQNGFIVLSPKITKIINPKDSFIRFASDKSKPIKTIENIHLKSIDQSDLLFIVNPGGYIGNSTLMEIGYAIAKNKIIVSTNKISDLLLSQYIETLPISIESPPIVIGIKNKLNKLNITNKLDDVYTISAIQKYMRKKVIERGFENETEKDTLLLMVEEIGELAEIIRKYSGIKVDIKRISEVKIKNIEDELADIFIYLIILANKYGIDLNIAFKHKEIKNNSRTWIKFNS